MTILYSQGDAIKGERIICVFRKMTKPVIISGTHRHKAQRATIYGIPAEAWIEKPFKYK